MTVRNTSIPSTLRGKQTGKTALQVVLIAIGGVLMLAAFAVVVFFVAVPVISLEHYNRVYQNPLTVTATVTVHDDYDDEGDTDYRSYISYQAGGRSYSDIQFEDKDTASELTPIGTQLQVQVSPEDPGRLISELEGEGRMLIFSAPMLMYILSGLAGMLIRNRRSRGICGTPDRETIARDLKLTILGRMSHFFWFLIGAGYLTMWWRYPAVYQKKTLIAAAVCGVTWLWCVFRDIRDDAKVRHQEFEVRRDELVQKEYIPDSEGDTYRLHYRSGERTWSRDVSERYYNSVSEGAKILAVYLPGEKKPSLHYDLDGNAG